MDTESATDITFLQRIGVDIHKRFIYAQPKTVEQVFEYSEKLITKIRDKEKFDKPVTILWDSVAATPSSEEDVDDYDDNHIGVQARKIGQGMRKIIRFFGEANVCFIAINQLRYQIGKMFGDPMITPGGKTIPFFASVRVRLHKGKKIIDPNDKDKVIGINTRAQVIKNRIAPPFREVDLSIYFKNGIDDLSSWCQVLSDYNLIKVAGSKGNVINLGDFGIKDGEELFFKKDDFADVLRANPKIIPCIKSKLEDIYIVDFNKVEEKTTNESELSTGN